MTERTGDWAGSLLSTWFEELKSSQWYNRSDALDTMLRARFSDVLDRESRNAATSFLKDPETALAAIILFDQIPRNIHRGTNWAFAYDPLARSITQGVIARDLLHGYEKPQMQFVLMPLMHSEDLQDQDLSVKMFAAHAPGALDFAQAHRDAVARFGRFPHRNQVLGRASTVEEAEAIAAGLAW